MRRRGCKRQNHVDDDKARYNLKQSTTSICPLFIAQLSFSKHFLQSKSKTLKMDDSENQVLWKYWFVDPPDMLEGQTMSLTYCRLEKCSIKLLLELKSEKGFSSLMLNPLYCSVFPALQSMLCSSSCTLLISMLNMMCQEGNCYIGEFVQTE